MNIFFITQGLIGYSLKKTIYSSNILHQFNVGLEVCYENINVNNWRRTTTIRLLRSSSFDFCPRCSWQFISPYWHSEPNSTPFRLPTYTTMGTGAILLPLGMNRCLPISVHQEFSAPLETPTQQILHPNSQWFLTNIQRLDASHRVGTRRVRLQYKLMLWLRYLLWWSMQRLAPLSMVILCSKTKRVDNWSRKVE